VLNHQDDCRSIHRRDCHPFLPGESLNDTQTVKNLVKKITSNYKLPYFSLTPTSASVRSMAISQANTNIVLTNMPTRICQIRCQVETEVQRMKTRFRDINFIGRDAQMEDQTAKTQIRFQWRSIQGSAIIACDKLNKAQQEFSERNTSRSTRPRGITKHLLA